MPDKTLPAWLTKLQEKKDQLLSLGLSAEEADEALKSFMLHADYTQKTQQIAPLRELAEQHKDVDWAKAAEWYAWAQTDWPRFLEDYNRLRTAKPAGDAASGATNVTGASPAKGTRKWGVSNVNDLVETDRLWGAFNEVADTAIAEAQQQFRTWYEGNELKRLDQTAQNYLDLALSLVKPVYAKLYGEQGIDFDQLLQAAATRNTRDFAKVIEELVREKKGTYDAAFEAGMKRAHEEHAKANGGTNGTVTQEPPGPTGGGTPGWRPHPGAATPKTKEERYAAVMQAVAQKSGRPVPQ